MIYMYDAEFFKFNDLIFALCWGSQSTAFTVISAYAFIWFESFEISDVIFSTELEKLR